MYLGPAFVKMTEMPEATSLETTLLGSLNNGMQLSDETSPVLGI